MSSSTGDLESEIKIVEDELADLREREEQLRSKLMTLRKEAECARTNSNNDTRVENVCNNVKHAQYQEYCVQVKKKG